MLEILESYGQAVTQLDNRILVGAGIAAVIAGLCIWLAGSEARGLVFAAIGALIGVAIVLTKKADGLTVPIVVAFAFCIAAMLIDKKFSASAGIATAWRMFLSILFSAFGSAVIYAGMIALLIYKGAEPIKLITERTSEYTTVFLAMVGFGAAEQMLLCRHKVSLKTKKQSNNDNQSKE